MSSTQTFVPRGDVSVGAWIAPPLWERIFDSEDGDGIQIIANDSSTSCGFSFNTPPSLYAAGSTRTTLRVRARKTAGDGSLQARLTNGTDPVGDLFAFSVTSSFVWYEQAAPLGLTESDLVNLEVDLDAILINGDTVQVSLMEVVFLTLPTTPGAFTAPIEGNVRRGELVVAWGASTDPDGGTVQYEGEYSDDAGVSWSSLFSLQVGLSYTWDRAGFTEGTEYQVRVRAHDGTNYSDSWRESGVFYISPPQADAGTPDVSGGCTA